MRIDRTPTLILKGGGIKGLAFTGALEQLEDAGFTFKTYVGTSAGAVATVLLAAGHSGRSLHELLDATDFAAFQDAGPIRRLVNFVFRGGLYPGDLLRNWVVTNVRGRSALADKQRYPLVKMKDLGRQGTRALVFASHTLVGTITFDSHGENADTDVGHAVRLSCSIPGFFIPGDYQGHRVYDGGLLHNFPIEVYQRVRATPPAHGDEDFIALYLGRTPSQEVRRGWRKWWAIEMLEIMLTRDDTIVLTRHIDRTIVIETDPIATTEFTLSDDEKALLVHRGRLAALMFLKRQADENGLCGALPVAEIDDRLTREQNAAADLDRRVHVIRRNRRLVSWGRRAAAACVLALAVTGASIGAQEWFPPEFDVDQNVNYVKHYLDESSSPTDLAPDAIGEISDIYTSFPAQLTNDSLQFDRVMQLVLHYTHTDRSFSAVKVVLMEGVADVTTNKVVIKLFGSVPSNDLKISGLVMAEEADGWKYIPAEFISGEKAGAVQERRLNVRTDLPALSNKRIRVVSMMSYNKLFLTSAGQPLTAIPWIMNAHRFLKRDGEATYMFMSEDPKAVRFPQHLYTKTDPAVFRRLVRPPALMKGADIWTRLQIVKDVMHAQPLLDQLTPEQKGIVRRVLTRLDAAQASNGQGAFQFTFDRRNTAHMSPKPEDLNLLVFAENKASGPAPASNDRASGQQASQVAREGMPHQ